MIRGEFVIDILVSFAKFDCFVATIIFGEFLFDNIRFDSDTEMVCLSVKSAAV